MQSDAGHSRSPTRQQDARSYVVELNDDEDVDEDLIKNDNGCNAVSSAPAATPPAGSPQQPDSSLLFVQGICSFSFESGDSSFKDVGWSIKKSQHGNMNEAFVKNGWCLGVLECPNKCGYTGRPYTYVFDADSSYKSRQFCRGVCYERSVPEEERRLVLRACGVKMQWCCAGKGEHVTFMQFGSHFHARPPLLKMTASEKTDLQRSVTAGVSAKKSSCLRRSTAALRISMFGV